MVEYNVCFLYACFLTAYPLGIGISIPFTKMLASCRSSFLYFSLPLSSLYFDLKSVEFNTVKGTSLFGYRFLKKSVLFYFFQKVDSLLALVKEKMK